MKVYIDKNVRNYLLDPVSNYLGEENITFEKDADLLITFPRDDINKETFPNLKYVLLLSAGYDRLDVKQLEKEGVIITNATGVYSEAIAEFVFAQILSIYKDLYELRTNHKEGIWKRDYSFLSLRDKNVFLLGTGSIADEIAVRLKPFGSKVIGFNTRGTPLKKYDEVHKLGKLADLINEADIIIAALPSNKATNHLFNKDLVLKMKKNSILVNIGRGSLIDEASIDGHIEHLLALVLDVFEVEPLREDSFLWSSDNVYMSPHISFKSEFNNQKLIELVLHNLENIKKNKELINRII